MPEGPSLILFKEELARFVGQEVLEVGGNTKIGKERLIRQRLQAQKTWGKHLLWIFDGFAIRFHFLKFGVYYINSEKDRVPRLFLQYEKDFINFYACGVTLVTQPLDEVYDWSVDVLNPTWNVAAAKKKLQALNDVLLTDALLDQTIFSGIGNILKNELLYRLGIHPETVVADLPLRKLNELVNEAAPFTEQFLQWKRMNNTYLRSQWAVQSKKLCPKGHNITKEYIGELQRLSYFCEACQKQYGKSVLNRGRPGLQPKSNNS